MHGKDTEQLDGSTVVACLAKLLCLHASVRSWRVNEGDDGEAMMISVSHHAESLSIPAMIGVMTHSVHGAMLLSALQPNKTFTQDVLHPECAGKDDRRIFRRVWPKESVLTAFQSTAPLAIINHPPLK